RLEGQQHVRGSFEFAQVGRSGNGSFEISEDAFNLQTVTPDRRKMRAARDDPDLCSRTRQRSGDETADRARAKNDDHEIRRRADSNCRMELLQSSALPLGYVAAVSGWRESNPRVDLGKVTGYHYITPARGWA